MNNSEMTRDMFHNTCALKGLTSQILRNIQKVDSMSNDEIKEMRQKLFEVYTEIRLITSCLERLDYKNSKSDNEYF
jgi:hypothetical protein